MPKQQVLEIRMHPILAKILIRRGCWPGGPDGPDGYFRIEGLQSNLVREVMDMQNLDSVVNKITEGRVAREFNELIGAGSVLQVTLDVVSASATLQPITKKTL